MKKITIAVVLIALAGCAQLSDPGHPDWLRDPARGDYPYTPSGW